MQAGRETTGLARVISKRITGAVRAAPPWQRCAPSDSVVVVAPFHPRPARDGQARGEVRPCH